MKKKPNKRRIRVDNEELKNRNLWVALALGILISAPLFYMIGVSVQKSACAAKISDLQEKYQLTSRALNTQISQNAKIMARLQYLESSVRSMSKALQTISSQLSEIKTSGSADGIVVSAQAVNIVSPQFCISVDLKNETNRQKILRLGITGSNIVGETETVSLYAGGEKTVDVCGQLNEVAASAQITIDGVPAVKTILILR